MPNIPHPNWLAIARDLGYADERAMWQALYDRFTLRQLALRFSMKTEVIRREILRAGLQLRRGGYRRPHARNIPKLSFQEARALQKEGISTAAKRLGMTYMDLYYQIKKTMRAELRKQRERDEAGS